ncbi:hypothetical protein SBF1_7660002 [Candidatus Desulfosporosinus infrequens]|uniref:Transposase n=1 Tax=Candidatus Desulfosporosinus infrequens TaxID=2043169 RepID=A0A2U3LRH3_9FIRM|nr:hypothetical protein SBF1_7660002 [Candidatus Desulfosporosinus infrequens]
MLVKKWARDGLTEVQICKNLGISVQALNNFKKQHIELVDALKAGREVLITEIENALVKRALGSNYEETKVSIRDVDGKQVKFTEKTNKYIPPDVAACFILLKNKDRERGWSDNPIKMELERQKFEFLKLIETVKVFGDDSEDSSTKLE